MLWMPSHTSNADGSYRIKSDGSAITTAQWRANQLADSLAKTGALVSPLREEADKLVKTAGVALLQSASELGVVTLASNVHLIEGTKQDGSKVVMAKRDSTPMPLALAKVRDEGRLRAIAVAVDKQPAPLAEPRAAAPLVPLTLTQAKAKKRRTVAAAAKLAEGVRVEQLATATAARGAVQPESAANRLAALKRRVLDKSTGPVAGTSSSQPQ